MALLRNDIGKGSPTILYPSPVFRGFPLGRPRISTFLLASAVAACSDAAHNAPRPGRAAQEQPPQSAAEQQSTKGAHPPALPPTVAQQNPAKTERTVPREALEDDPTPAAPVDVMELMRAGVCEKQLPLHPGPPRASLGRLLRWLCEDRGIARDVDSEGGDSMG